MTKVKAMALPTELLLNIRGLTKDPLRSFSLEKIHIDYTIADMIYLNTFDRNLYVRIQYIVHNILPSNSHIHNEKNLTFDPFVLADSNLRFYKSFWLSYKYFEHQIENVNKIFSFQNDKVNNFESFSNNISCTESVDIHLVRGDYIESKQILDVHGVCSKPYYKRAVKILSQLYLKLHIYIFSGDLAIKQKNSKVTKKSTVISGKGLTYIEEFHSMILSKYKIIVNSGFSWLGAYLSKSIKFTSLKFCSKI